MEIETYLCKAPFLKFERADTTDLGSGANELHIVATQGSSPQLEAHDDVCNFP